MSGIETGKDMKLLHYSLEKGFEVLSVDQRSEGFAVLFDDLSPTAFLIASGDSSSAADSGKADSSKTSPKTEDSSNWMLWIAAAFVLAGTSAVVMRRKEN